MDQAKTPAIVRLVAFHGGPSALSQKLDGVPVYQEIQRWVKRGWASPMHIFRLEALLPDGMTVKDLDADRALLDVLPEPVAEPSGEAVKG